MVRGSREVCEGRGNSKTATYRDNGEHRSKGISEIEVSRGEIREREKEATGVGCEMVAATVDGSIVHHAG